MQKIYDDVLKSLRLYILDKEIIDKERMVDKGKYHKHWNYKMYI